MYTTEVKFKHKEQSNAFALWLAENDIIDIFKESKWNDSLKDIEGEDLSITDDTTLEAVYGDDGDNVIEIYN